MFSVHMPNGSGNGWAKIDAFDALAATLDERPAGDVIVAGDFTGHSVSKAAGWSFAYEDGEQPDVLWRRRGTHTRSGSIRGGSGRRP